jgi:carbon storage regulator
MLKFLRKVGERFLIGDRITVEIRRVTGDIVDIGIVAPKDVKILREELLEQKVRSAQK